MKLQNVTTACLATLLGLSAWAWGQAEAPALPQGHPDITQMRPGAPPEGQMQMPALPKGHPEIPGLTKHQAPATQPSSLGTVTIRAIQATQGGPVIANEKVKLRLYLSDGQVLDTIDTTLDDKGVAVVKDLPLKLPVHPVVSFIRSGVEYQEVGDVLDSYHPQQIVDVPVYEVTETPPDYQITMRHVMIQPEADGLLHVHEMLQIENPSDRAWIGRSDGKGGRVTLTLALPEGIDNVQAVEGFHDCCTRIEEGRLVHPAALMPGPARYRLSYTVAPKKGQAVLRIGTDAPTKHLMVFLPASGATATASGLETGTQEMGPGNTVRYFRGQNVPGGQEFTLAVSDFAAAMPLGSQASSSAAQLVAFVGGGILLLVAVAFFFIKAPKATGKKR